MNYSKYKIVIGGTRAARDKYRKEFDCLAEASKRFDAIKRAAPSGVHLIHLIGQEPGGVERLVRFFAFASTK
jgi:hypothetical protein